MGFNPQRRLPTGANGKKGPSTADIALVVAALVVCVGLVLWGLLGR
jgi:hypothetical protein